MQAQPGFEKFSMVQTAKAILKADGVLGLYRYVVLVENC